MNDKVIVITGPTATGKTALGVMLAKKIDGEIVSADSMQVYKRLDIGTAKVTPGEMDGVAHHLIDIADPSEDFSVAKYVDCAQSAISDIFERKKTPIIVGGTGLYIDSLLAGRDFACPSSDSLRQELSDQYDRIGGEAFLQKLRLVDPERAAKLFPLDKKRLIRAMEVFTLTGETITEHDLRTKFAPPRYESYRFALNFTDRAVLYERINARVDAMVEKGLFDEVQALLEDNLGDSCISMQAIGYKEAASFFRGETSKEEAIEAIKLASRRYAKRQLTWLTRHDDVNWITWKEKPNMDSALSQILSIIK